MTRYRLVSNYGYGDKSWVDRFLLAGEAIAALNSRLGHDAVTTIEEALDYDHWIYSLEEDAVGDTEDWDWMDS